MSYCNLQCTLALLYMPTCYFGAGRRTTHGNIKRLHYAFIHVPLEAGDQEG